MIDTYDCLYSSPKNLIVWHANPDEFALDAWERMTDGGARVCDFAPFIGLRIDCWIDARCPRYLDPDGD